MVDGFPDGVSSGEFLLELRLADATKEEAIPLEVLGLILGGDDDLEAAGGGVGGVGHALTMPRILIPARFISNYFHPPILTPRPA